MKTKEPGYGESELLQKHFFDKRGLRAQLARDYKSEGLSESLISQHLNGMRPISLHMALIYCRALGCHLDDVSPSWAQEIRRAAQKLKHSDQSIDALSVAEDVAQYKLSDRKNLDTLMQLAKTLGNEEVDYLIAKARALGASDPVLHERKSVSNGL